MNEITRRAIEISRETLRVRPEGEAKIWSPLHSVPTEIADFFRFVSGGILFPVSSDFGSAPNGFEILESTLFWSVNELLGNPTEPNGQGDYLDRCRVLFSAVADQCLLFGVDLNESHYGWMFVSNLNPGNNPYECSEYQAKSFEEWLELNLRIHSRDLSVDSTAGNIPKFGRVGDRE